MKKVKTIKISRHEVERVVSQIPFTAFWGCSFIKKDKSFRKMNCNRSISRGLKNQRKPTPISSSSIQVYDINVKNDDGTKGGYRKVNLETVTEIRTAGKKYIVV